MQPSLWLHLPAAYTLAIGKVQVQQPGAWMDGCRGRQCSAQRSAACMRLRTSCSHSLTPARLALKLSTFSIASMMEMPRLAAMPPAHSHRAVNHLKQGRKGHVHANP